MTEFTSSSMLQRRPWQLAAFMLSAIIGNGIATDQAHAVVELNITQGNIQAMPIAIPNFASDGTIDAGAAREISDVVSNDLKSSGLFLPIDPAAFIEKGLDVA